MYNNKTSKQAANQTNNNKIYKYETTTNDKQTNNNKQTNKNDRINMRYGSCKSGSVYPI